MVCIRNLKEWAVLSYLKKNQYGACITGISKGTGIGRPVVKDICFCLLGRRMVDVRVDVTDKGYNTLIFFSKT